MFFVDTSKSYSPLFRGEKMLIFNADTNKMYLSIERNNSSCQCDECIERRVFFKKKKFELVLGLDPTHISYDSLHFAVLDYCNEEIVSFPKKISEQIGFEVHLQSLFPIPLTR
jgi:hypothetical protein